MSRKNNGIREALKLQRREDAIARQAAHDGLTAKQKLDKLDRAGWVAKKERARLAKLIG
jgi:hypothetical protein